MREFWLYYRWDGRPRYCLIGEVGHPAWTLEQADEEVRALRRRIRKAQLRQQLDPLRAPIEIPEPEPVTTLRALAEEYQKLTTKSDKVKREDEGRWRNHVLPFKVGGRPLAKRAVHTITARDLWDLRSAMDNKRIAFNRVLRMLSNAFNMARTWDRIPVEAIRDGWENPTSGVDPYPEKTRERTYKPPEISGLLRTLSEMIEGSVGEVGRGRKLALMRSRSLLGLRLMVRTGHRPGELHRLEWSMVHWDGGFADLKRQKGDRKRVRGRLLAFGQRSMADLRTLESLSAGSAFVFPSRHDPEKHLGETGFRKAWDALKSAAARHSELPSLLETTADVYALRHTVVNSHSHPDVRVDFADMVDFVGHSKGGTTHRYRHSNARRLVSVAQRVEDYFEELSRVS
ncbi:MAG: tyrosine-type recombinase/integrase [Acidobacteriota bacterium]